MCVSKTFSYVPLFHLRNSVNRKDTGDPEVRLDVRGRKDCSLTFMFLLFELVSEFQRFSLLPLLYSEKLKSLLLLPDCPYRCNC